MYFTPRIDAQRIFKTNTMLNKRHIQKRIDELKKDSRLKSPLATVFSNAPLALIQLGALTELNTLERVLEIPLTLKKDLEK